MSIKLTYILQEESGTRAVKIGSSSDTSLYKRLVLLQTGNPNRLRVLFLFRGESVEGRLQSLCERFWIRGEWFKEDCLPDLSREIEKMKLERVALPEWLGALGTLDVMRKRSRDRANSMVDILAFFDENGRRPTHADMAGVATYLFKREGTTISKVCDELGLPSLKKGKKTSRTLEGCESDIREFFEAHGRRPTQKDMKAVNSYLTKKHKTSIPKVCDLLGLPKLSHAGRGAPSKGNQKKRSIEKVREEIRQFVEAKGRRPTADDMSAVHQWLKHNHKISLSKFCDQEGFTALRIGAVKNRNMETVKAELLAFHEIHGRRPVAQEVSGIYQWLRKHKHPSLKHVCDELGLPETPSGPADRRVKLGS